MQPVSVRVVFWASEANLLQFLYQPAVAIFSRTERTAAAAKYPPLAEVRRTSRADDDAGFKEFLAAPHGVADGSETHVEAKDKTVYKGRVQIEMQIGLHGTSGHHNQKQNI